LNYLFQNPDFSDLITQTARQLKMPTDFVEKDYWVTYVLYRLVKEGVDDFVFKGGTSLSKGWNLIDRFSEDIDLLFVPSSISKDRQRSRLKKVNTLVSSFDGLNFDKDNSENSGSYRADRFNYSRVTSSSTGLLLPYIKLEMGYRGGDSPQTRVPIQSYLGKLIEKTGTANSYDDVAAFEVPVLDPKRTFVEKLFAIHSAYTNNQIEKYVRHYYDVYKLLEMSDVRDFVGTAQYSELKKHVAQVSKQFFKTVPPPDLDFAQSPAFASSPELIAEIDRSLNRQKDLYFSALPKAEQILAKISGLT
jgi:predicted nucleotidyltransferase component of viral defense system